MKKIFVCLFILFSSLLISNKVSATSTYCEFGNLKLSLPTTISVEIQGFNYDRPMDNYDKYVYIESHYIYDKESCNTPIQIPYIYQESNGLNFITENYKSYCVGVSYYYYYNNTRYISIVPLLGGIYTYTDTIAPTIKLLKNNINISMENPHTVEDLRLSVNVIDDTSINIEPTIIYDSYTQNYNIPGNYQIIYEACDNSLNCSKAIQEITVIDNISPTITGETFFTSFMSNPLALDQIGSSLKATDNYDGNITHLIYTVDSSYNLDVPGEYYATFSVKDKSENEVKEMFRVNILYVDDIAPVIEGPTKFISYLSKKLSTQDIISNLVASDNVDQHVMENLYIKSDQYSYNSNNKGEYKLVVSCFDKNDNESLPYIILIEVIDDVKPVIEGPQVYTSNLSNSLSISNIKNKLMAMDNHDGNITHKLEVKEDTYSLNKQNIGVYYISFIVNDSSNNESDLFLVEITNIDDVLPSIEGNNYYLTTTDNKLEIFSLTQSLIAIDNVDKDISNKIELNDNNYSENYYKPGIYYITYYVCDKSGNISLPFKIKIVVNNSLSYINSLNNSIIYLDTSHLVDSENILKSLDIKTENYIEIKEVENTYLLNYSTIGKYKITYEITNTDYSKEYLNITINTYSNKGEKSEEINNNSKEKKKETIFFYIVSFFKNLFLNISNNFKNLFN